jgi:hypothetical protein
VAVVTTPGADIPPNRAGTSTHIADLNNVKDILRGVVGADPAAAPGQVTPSVVADKNGFWDASINRTLAAGKPAILPAGVLKTQFPIVIPPGGIIRGNGANEVATYLDALFGTVIQPAATWKQGDCPANAVVACLGSDSGGYSTPSEEQKADRLMIDCHLLPGTGATANTDGVQLFGGVARTHWERILVAQPPRYGFNPAGDQNSPGGSFRLERFNVRYAGSTGIVIFKTSDVTLRDCLTENCAGHGFDITNLSNGMLLNCRAEHNGSAALGNGFNYNCTNSSTGSGTAMFIACSTDRNEGNGIEIASTNNSGVPVQLTGCRFRRDGANGNAGGGSLAGIYIHNYPGAVCMDGTVVFPGVNDSGSGTNSPDIGLRIHSNSANGYVMGAACWFHGNTQGKADDGTSAAATFAASYKAFGSTGGPTVTPA